MLQGDCLSFLFNLALTETREEIFFQIAITRERKYTKGIAK